MNFAHFHQRDDLSAATCQSIRTPRSCRVTVCSYLKPKREIGTSGGPPLGRVVLRRVFEMLLHPENRVAVPVAIHSDYLPDAAPGDHP